MPKDVFSRSRGFRHVTNNNTRLSVAVLKDEFSRSQRFRHVTNNNTRLSVAVPKDVFSRSQRFRHVTNNKHKTKCRCAEGRVQQKPGVQTPS